MAAELGGVVACREECLLIGLLDPSIAWFGEVKWHIKCSFYNWLHMSACTGAVAIGCGGVVTRRGGFSPVGSHGPLCMCSWGRGVGKGCCSPFWEFKKFFRKKVFRAVL